MDKKIWAVGDLHGHFDQWLRLYDKMLRAGFNPDTDTLVFLGDYVDGGHQVKQTIDWLIEHKKKYPHWQMLYGNHEDLMLDALVYRGRIYNSYDLWWGQGGRETYQSYLPKDLGAYEKAISQVRDHIPQEHLHFLMKLPRYYETDKYFFIHAGIPTHESIESFTRKIDDPANDKAKYEAIWIRRDFLMNIKDWGKKIIFGHTIFPYGPFLGTNPETGERTRRFGYPHIAPNKIGIDGMAHDVGNLIVIQLPEERFILESSEI